VIINYLTFQKKADYIEVSLLAFVFIL